jgi:hypothetical protein
MNPPLSATPTLPSFEVRPRDYCYSQIESTALGGNFDIDPQGPPRLESGEDMQDLVQSVLQFEV